ncbi:DUF2939 domain-containing protein [Caulobacter sp. CCG-8]|uniref:DUF2939 domain-containing protein n=1 Tax=Caulobacter sp. CCG-8 TaxID=3127958 RepID=UPI00307D55EC
MGEFETSGGAAGRRRGPSRPLVAGGVLLALLVLVLLGWAAASPYRYGDAVRDAAQAGDRQRLEALVDFPAVRDQMATDFKATLLKPTPAESEDYEGGGFEAVAGSFLDLFITALIDQVVTPAGLEKAATGKPVLVEAIGASTDPVASAFPKDGQGRRFRVETRYLAVDRFRYTLVNDARKSRIDIDLRRQGLFGWRAVRVTPRMDLLDLVGQHDDETALAADAAPPPADAAPAAEQMTRLSGEVDAAHAEAFLSKVADHLDGIVGVQVWIEPSEGPEATYQVGQDDDRLVISNETYELLAPKGAWRWEHGRYVVDGFFLVKNGGVHQGVSSLGLEAVSESAVRLKPNLTVVDAGF